MYIRLVNFKAAPGKKAELTKLADKFIPLIKAREGNKGCKFIIDDEAGEYGLVAYWDTKENAAAAKAVIGPELIPLFTEMAGAPPTIRLYEEYES